MNIQSLSVVVPNPQCINHCKFCVSRMHCNRYKNQMDDNLPFFDLYLKDYLKRLEFARSNGCNTIMLTGNSEPQQNRKFLTYFGMMMQMMRDPFQWIEMQTTGVGLDRNYLRFLRNHVGVNVISISLSSFNPQQNAEIIGMPKGHEVDLQELCGLIKEYDFTLRLSINMTDAFACMKPETIFSYASEVLGADQITIRGMYDDGTDTPQAQWVREHRLDTTEVIEYIKLNGKKLGVLPYGYTKYSIHGLTTVVDTDCMSKAEQESETYKYLILQPDCKLYSQWDDKASIIF